MALHPDVQAFADALRDLEAHLSRCGEAAWASRVASCATLVERASFRGVENFLALFGGMGSLNDLVLHRNGQWLTVENDELNARLTRAGSLASRLYNEEKRVEMQTRNGER